LLLENRAEAVEFGMATLGERIAWKAWKTGSLNRKMMNMGSGKLKNWMINKVFKPWTAHRGKLDFSDKTFNQMWQDRKG
jgi:L-lactate dehydrogenase complex protein LldF